MGAAQLQNRFVNCFRKYWYISSACYPFLFKIFVIYIILYVFSVKKTNLKDRCILLCAEWRIYVSVNEVTIWSDNGLWYVWYQAIA